MKAGCHRGPTESRPIVFHPLHVEEGRSLIGEERNARDIRKKNETQLSFVPYTSGVCNLFSYECQLAQTNITALPAAHVVYFQFICASDPVIRGFSSFSPLCQVVSDLKYRSLFLH